jgi:hypothetical protein
MKNSLSKPLLCALTLMSVTGLVGCAGLMGGEDTGRGPSSDYDRGYEPPTTDESVPADCSGRFCDKQDGHHLPRAGHTTAENEDQRAQDAIHARDVVIGMTRSQVMASWGEPSVRDVAGNGSDGHERWHYGSRASLSGERIVIFEEGRVAGWYR